MDGSPFLLEAGQKGVLLSHGFTATTVEVQLLAERLHKAGYTVGAPLLPGHNSQPEALNQVRWQDWLAAAEAMYLRLKETCQSVVVGGESTGALLALCLASQYPEAAAVLAYAPALKLNLSAFDHLRLKLLAPFIPYVHKTNVDPTSHWSGYTVNPLKGTLQLIHLQNETLRRLPQIRQPVLIVQGRLDPTVHPSVPGLIAQNVGSKVKEIHWMENSRHTVIIDRELDAVVEITLKFLEQNF